MVRLSSELATHGAIDPVALPSSTSKQRLSRSAFTGREGKGTASTAGRGGCFATRPCKMMQQGAAAAGMTFVSGASS